MIEGKLRAVKGSVNKKQLRYFGLHLFQSTTALKMILYEEDDRSYKLFGRNMFENHLLLNTAIDHYPPEHLPVNETSRLPLLSGKGLPPVLKNWMFVEEYHIKELQNFHHIASVQIQDYQLLGLEMKKCRLLKRNNSLKNHKMDSQFPLKKYVPCRDIERSGRSLTRLENPSG